MARRRAILKGKHMTSDRQNRLRQRKKEQGLVRVEVYIPPDRKAELMEFARQLCEGVDDTEQNR